jgi:hypothetical protein
VRRRLALTASPHEPRLEEVLEADQYRDRCDEYRAVDERAVGHAQQERDGAEGEEGDDGYESAGTLRNHSFEYRRLSAEVKMRGVRIALISDLHGIDVAFAAAVRDLERVDVERVVCLGDVLQGGAQPTQTGARLRELGCGVVLGNADAFLLEVPADSAEPVTERLLEVRHWTLRELATTAPSSSAPSRRRWKSTATRGSSASTALPPRSYDDVLIPELEEASLEPFLGHGR